jgi:TRAP-type C4-dicarboxylate transport system permease small subunit
VRYIRRRMSAEVSIVLTLSLIASLLVLWFCVVIILYGLSQMPETLKTRNHSNEIQMDGVERSLRV